ncbi:single-stranded DNA-binding protein [Dyella sp.]|uniref:single-stranded DNA-binding protein n=1 Tax=Dyella sp. TaxID=1869338 RepID=UPI0028469B14|nr:single-stranded DNA-binding protein [Dyella sp.]MDR3445145.1 single-stranded DNA-binding protein [Dyella sp.]
MPRINVKDTNVHERTFNGKDGKQQIIREQRASLDLGDGYELPFRVGLGTGAVHPVGAYDISPESFSLGRFGDLELSRYLKLVPVKVAAPVATKVA